MNIERKKDFIVSFIFYAAIILCIYLALKFLFTPLLPFILSFAVVSLSQKAVKMLTSKTFLSHKICVTFITLLIIILAGLILYFIIYSIFKEVSDLVNYLSNNAISSNTKFTDKIMGIFESLESMEFIGPIATKLKKLISTADDILIKTVSQYMPQVISAVIQFLSVFPKAMVFATFFLISLFYIGFDYDKIIAFFKLQTSVEIKKDVTDTLNVFITTIKNISKAYGILTLFTFFQLLCGFLILKIDYSFLLSFIISIIDLLPILGTGTVLIPWAIFCFIFEDVVRGIGILTIYATITVLRQFLEPKIVGIHIGLNPLISLISMYAGLQTIGISGIIIVPIFAATIINLNERDIIRLYKNPPESTNIKAEKAKKKFLNFKKNDK